MRALAKEIKRGSPTLEVRDHELIWVGFHLIRKSTKSTRNCILYWAMPAQTIKLMKQSLIARWKWEKELQNPRHWMRSYKMGQQFFMQTSIRSRYNWNTEYKQNTALNEELLITELALVANVGHSLEIETSNCGRSLGGLDYLYKYYLLVLVLFGHCFGGLSWLGRKT